MNPRFALHPGRTLIYASQYGGDAEALASLRQEEITRKSRQQAKIRAGRQESLRDNAGLGTQKINPWIQKAGWVVERGNMETSVNVAQAIGVDLGINYIVM